MKKIWIRLRDAFTRNPASIGTGRSSAARLWRDRKGATAVEFGMIAIPLLGTVTALVETSYDFYVARVLDMASQAVARSVMTGAAQASRPNKQDFINQACAALPHFMTCSQVVVDVRVISGGSFYNGLTAMGLQGAYTNNGLYAVTPSGSPPVDNSQTQFCLGGPGDYVLLQIIFPAPAFSTVWTHAGVMSSANGKVRVYRGTAIVRNESITGASSC